MLPLQRHMSRNCTEIHGNSHVGIDLEHAGACLCSLLVTFFTFLLSVDENKMARMNLLLFVSFCVLKGLSALSGLRYAPQEE